MDAVGVRYHNTAPWADKCAMLAFYAFFIVDNCQIVLNGNSAVRTFPFAFPAANAAMGAFPPGDRPRFVVVAGNDDAFYIGDDANAVIWTSGRAFSAADAQPRLDMGDAVFQINRIVRALRHTVSQADTAEGACAVPSKKEFRG